MSDSGNQPSGQRTGRRGVWSQPIGEPTPQRLPTGAEQKAVRARKKAERKARKRSRGKDGASS
jgi:hypothetical protein